MKHSPCKGCEFEKEDKKFHDICSVCEKPSKYEMSMDRCLGASSPLPVKKIKPKPTKPKKPTPTSKICNKPDCEFNGQSQPISNFDRAKGMADGYSGECKSCRRRRQRINQKVQRADNKDHVISLDFRNHTDLYDQIVKEAKEHVYENLGNYLLYWIKAIWEASG